MKRTMCYVSGVYDVLQTLYSARWVAFFKLLISVPLMGRGWEPLLYTNTQNWPINVETANNNAVQRRRYHVSSRTH